jgi:hypothetical protein
MATPDIGLTPVELAVLDNLAQAWNGFLSLAEKHPDDVQMFRLGVHFLQDLIAFRVARRVNPLNYSPIDPSGAA